MNAAQLAEAVAATSRQQLALRALVVAGAALALASAAFASPSGWVGWVGVVVLAAAVGAAIRPDSQLPLLTVGCIGIRWLTAVDDVGTPWAVGAGIGVLLVHAGCALASVAPASAPLPAAMLRRWSRRTALVACSTVAAWAVVRGALELEPSGRAPLVAGVLAVLGASALWLLVRSRTDDAVS